MFWFPAINLTKNLNEMGSSKYIVSALILNNLLSPVWSVQMCDVMSEIELQREKCENESRNITAGCKGIWDIIACWPSARVGEIVTISCPNYFSYYDDQHKGNLSKTCTSDGWTKMHPVTIALNCGYNLNGTGDEGKFYSTVKIGYTIGHSVSLISLGTAIVILCVFSSLTGCVEDGLFYTETAASLGITVLFLTFDTALYFIKWKTLKLHCTRNYIHMHLFMSFMLKAIAVFIKDAVLYDVGEPDNCSTRSVGCKAVIVFFQYCIMASFFWLLVEGLYLHALLAVSFFSERKYFWWYILIGWGGPTVFIAAWTITKAYLNDVGCWDIIEVSDSFWWIIKTPILASILINFILLVCIVRILRQKINCPDMGRNQSHQYSRLAKSTLLLIPLFGINYIIFAFIPDHMKTELRLVFDLILGSFQGCVVAVLYCFLNGEVQAEIKRKWRRRHLERFLVARTKYQQPSIGSNGNNFSTQISILTRSSPKVRRASSCQEDSMF